MTPKDWIHLGSLGINYNLYPLKFTSLENNHPWIKLGCTSYAETKDGSKKYIIHATGYGVEVIDGKTCAMFGG